MKNPLISVVIPAYKAESFIVATLESVRMQTYQNYELIVVDDGSPDRTAEVVQNYLCKSGIRGQVIRQENKKIAGARNTGINHANGEYIALLDHDDIWHSNKLERVVVEIKRNPRIGLFCHNEIAKRNGVQVRVIKNGPATDDMYSSLLFKGNALSPSATVFRKEAAISIGGFCENPEFNTVEDYDFWMRLSRVVKFMFIDEVLGEYTLVDTAASRQILYHYNNMEVMLKTHLEGYLNGKYGIYLRMLARRRLSVVYRAALTQLAIHNEEPLMQRSYATLMIKAYPFDWKNIIRLILWGCNKKHK